MKLIVRAASVMLVVAGTAAILTSCSSDSASPDGTPPSGAQGSGGWIALTGGFTAAGGAPGAGWTSAPGGAIGPGGVPGLGGLTGSGGITGAGGIIGAGGSPAGGTEAGGGGGPNASGGNTAAGGSAGAGGDMTGTGGTSGVTRSAGCGKISTMTFGTVPNEPPNGTGDGGYVTIQSAGQTRGFAMRLPENYDNNKPYWLIFGFHWNGGTASQVDNGGDNGYWWSYFGLQRKSNNGAIFVAPQGINNAWPNTGGRDLTFTDDMVKLIEDNYCVDTTHIITSGFSYGGGMSYELACARAKVFHAAVIYEGAQLSGCDGGNDPIALWQMVGLTDTVCGMNLATPIRDRFVRNNGCTPQSPPQPPQPPPYLSSGGHICTDYAGCSSGHPLRWCVHQSGHGPGPVDGNSDLYNSCATPPKSCSASCPCTWTPDDVWSWLQSF